jgi:hypothetical protein
VNQLAAKTDDQNELDEIIDHQSKKPVQILAHKPRRIEERLGHRRKLSRKNFRRTVNAAALLSQTAGTPDCHQQLPGSRLINTETAVVSGRRAMKGQKQ